MRKVLENLDVEWGVQDAREIQLAVEDMMESSLDVTGTPRGCLTFPPPTHKVSCDATDGINDLPNVRRTVDFLKSSTLSGKIAVIAEIIDHNRLCPLRCSQKLSNLHKANHRRPNSVPRQSYPYKQPTLDEITHGPLNTT